MRGNYEYRILYIRFVGTHSEYDRIDPVRNSSDHESALKRIEALMSAPIDTADGEELDVLATLVDAYEKDHFPIDSPDPVDAIKFRMEQLGLIGRES